MSKDELHKAWPYARKHLLEAIEAMDGTHGVSDIYDGIFRSEYQLWVGNRSAAVTQVLFYPNMKSLLVFLAGGDLEEIKHGCEVMAAGAKKLGFDRLEFGGRRGFAKILPGFKEISTYVVRTL